MIGVNHICGIYVGLVLAWLVGILYFGINPKISLWLFSINYPGLVIFRRMGFPWPLQVCRSYRTTAAGTTCSSMPPSTPRTMWSSSFGRCSLLLRWYWQCCCDAGRRRSLHNRRQPIRRRSQLSFGGDRRSLRMPLLTSRCWCGRGGRRWSCGSAWAPWCGSRGRRRSRRAGRATSRAWARTAAPRPETHDLQSSRAFKQFLKFIIESLEKED